MTLDDGRAELACDNGHGAGDDGAFGKDAGGFAIGCACLTGLRKERVRTH